MLSVADRGKLCLNHKQALDWHMTSPNTSSSVALASSLLSESSADTEPACVHKWADWRRLEITQLFSSFSKQEHLYLRHLFIKSLSPFLYSLIASDIEKLRSVTCCLSIPQCLDSEVASVYQVSSWIWGLLILWSINTLLCFVLYTIVKTVNMCLLYGCHLPLVLPHTSISLVSNIPLFKALLFL